MRVWQQLHTPGPPVENEPPPPSRYCSTMEEQAPFTLRQPPANSKPSTKWVMGPARNCLQGEASHARQVMPAGRALCTECQASSAGSRCCQLGAYVAALSQREGGSSASCSPPKGMTSAPNSCSSWTGCMPLARTRRTPAQAGLSWAAGRDTGDLAAPSDMPQQCWAPTSAVLHT